MSRISLTERKMKQRTHNVKDRYQQESLNWYKICGRGGRADITGSSSDLQVGRCRDQPGFSGLCSTNNLPKRSNKHTSQAIAARTS